MKKCNKEYGLYGLGKNITFSALALVWVRIDSLIHCIHSMYSMYSLFPLFSDHLSVDLKIQYFCIVFPIDLSTIKLHSNLLNKITLSTICLSINPYKNMFLIDLRVLNCV